MFDAPSVNGSASPFRITDSVARILGPLGVVKLILDYLDFSLKLLDQIKALLKRDYESIESPRKIDLVPFCTAWTCIGRFPAVI